MKIRAANSVEAPKLVEILIERQKDSRFAGQVGVDKDYARKLLAHAIHRHGHTNEGGTFVQVAERNGRIDAFIYGSLERVYVVGDKLCAQDVFLVGHKDADPRALPRLLEGYIEWASDNPRVFEIMASWTDVFEAGARFDGVYQRAGFVRSGGIYRRAKGIVAMGEAA